jgi:hypothetical protein
MKYIFLLISLFAAVNLHAQKKPIPFRSNEIGIGYRIPSYTQSYQSQIGFDLMYKHFTKPNKAYRLMLGFQNQDFRLSKKYYTYAQYTLLIKNKYYNYSTVFVGAGVQMQRHFYKRIFLTAAADTRFHMGKGKLKYNEVVNYSLAGNEQQKINSSDISDVKAFKWDLFPSIGAKFEFSHINFGMELTAAFMQYVSLKPSTSSELPFSLFDLDIGNNFTRFYINYRF